MCIVIILGTILKAGQSLNSDEWQLIGGVIFGSLALCIPLLVVMKVYAAWVIDRQGVASVKKVTRRKQE